MNKFVVVKADNADLYCRVMGAGDPLIVIHGGPGLSMDYLLPAMEELAKDQLVIFYDQRGNGKSTGEINDKTMRLDKFIEDLYAIQKHFNFKKVGLLGHSTGAYLAMSYAIKYPDQICKLILLNSIPIHSSINSSMAENPYESMIQAILESDAFKKDNAEGMIQFYKNLFKNFFYDPKLVDQLNLSMTAPQVKKSALIHKLFEENFFHQPHDLRDELKKLSSIPTLIIHGNAHDIPESVAREIHDLIKGSTLQILESGHFPYIEQPKQLFEYLAQFNKAIPKSAN